MFEKISFCILSERIEVEGQPFLLGELTTDILDITPDEFEKMYALSKKIESGNDKETVRELHVLLMQRRLFQVISKPDGLWTPLKYCEIISDIYSFNQTMFWFIDNFLMHLKKLDSENYAAALFDFYSHPCLDKMMVNYLRSADHAFTLFDNIEVRYLPREIPDKPDNYAIYEVYSVDGLQSFLKMDFMKAIMAGHIIRRCQNCHHLFLLNKGYKTMYCTRPLADNPKRNCRNQGAKNIAKEKAADIPEVGEYQLAFNRISSDLNRSRITREEAKRAKDEARNLKDRALADRDFAAKLHGMLQRDTLYASLNIVRKGGR